MGVNAASGDHRRKQVRVAQACSNCRLRKQKCEELKPCSFCKDNQVDCQHSPPKPDRIMMQLQETANKLKEILATETHLVGQLIDSVKPGEPSPLPPGQQYTPPVSSYTLGTTPQPSDMDVNGVHRRATQACNNCRQRKQKCDEQQPCSWCKNNYLECHYKDVPLPKKYVNMTKLQETVNGLKAAQDNQIHLIGQLMGRLPSLDHTKPGEPSRLQYDHLTPAHRVLQDWNCMKKFCDGLPYFESLKARGIPKGEYPMRLERDRGIFRV